MKPVPIACALLVSAGLVAAGCGKKSMDQTNLTGSGFDTLATTEELSQLPPQASVANQQTAVEVLPIETSPVSQGAAAPAVAPNPNATLSHNQEIQTALKNAGLYQGNIDGKIGPATRKAIETFQANNSLKADGKVGPKTWALLEPYLKQTQTSAPAAD